MSYASSQMPPLQSLSRPSSALAYSHHHQTQHPQYQPHPHPHHQGSSAHISSASHPHDHRMQPSAQPTHCYWSLLDRSLRFVYLDPVVVPIIEQHRVNRLLGTSILDLIHPEDRPAAEHDLADVLHSGNLDGTLTRARFSSLSRVRRVLGSSPPPSQYWSSSLSAANQSSSRTGLDSDGNEYGECRTAVDYSPVDLVVNIAADDLLLCFIHPADDIGSHNEPLQSRHHASSSVSSGSGLSPSSPYDLSSPCGSDSFSEEHASALHRSLYSTLSPSPHTSGPSLGRVFQIISNDNNLLGNNTANVNGTNPSQAGAHTLFLSWPPEHAHGLSAREFARLADGVNLANEQQQNQENQHALGAHGHEHELQRQRHAASRTSCTRRFKAREQTMSSLDAYHLVDSVFIPHGTIIFACHQVKQHPRSSTAAPPVSNTTMPTAATAPNPAATSSLHSSLYMTQPHQEYLDASFTLPSMQSLGGSHAYLSAHHSAPSAPAGMHHAHAHPQSHAHHVQSQSQAYSTWSPPPASSSSLPPPSSSPSSSSSSSIVANEPYAPWSTHSYNASPPYVPHQPHHQQSSSWTNSSYSASSDVVSAAAAAAFGTYRTSSPQYYATSDPPSSLDSSASSSASSMHGVNIPHGHGHSHSGSMGIGIGPGMGSMEGRTSPAASRDANIVCGGLALGVGNVGLPMGNSGAGVGLGGTAGTSSGANNSGSGRGSGLPPAGVERCSSCGATHSPEWRKGPSGRKDLCNACGLRFARSRAKKEGVLANQRKRREAKQQNAANRIAHAQMRMSPSLQQRHQDVSRRELDTPGASALSPSASQSASSTSTKSESPSPTVSGLVGLPGSGNPNSSPYMSREYQSTPPPPSYAHRGLSSPSYTPIGAAPGGTSTPTPGYAQKDGRPSSSSSAVYAYHAQPVSHAFGSNAGGGQTQLPPFHELAMPHASGVPASSYLRQ